MSDEYTFVKPSVRISKSDVGRITKQLLAKQGGLCPLCKSPIASGQACLDHDHDTGEIRSVLCRNCNGLEGRIRTRANTGKRKLSIAEWLQNIVDYWTYHAESRHGLLHYSYKTAEEKRLVRNAKARAARAAIKAKQKG